MKEESVKYLLTKGNKVLKNVKNRKTAKLYQTHCEKFVKWLAERGVKRPSQLNARYGGMKAAVQAWADALVKSGKSASTIHTYLSGVCVATGIPLDEIKKPRRSTSEYIRGRSGNGKNKIGRMEENDGRFARLTDFQGVVGIRRAEIRMLRGDDFVEDESRQPCVRVRKGKGGKAQLQRILPKDLAFVRSFFNGDPETRVFSRYEMANHINLHALRAAHARECYEYYAGLSQDDRNVLREELRQRFLTMAPDPGKISKFMAEIDKHRGRYFLRGKNREAAIGLGLPVVYDRLALMATSVFHLSHWRMDVTVCSYMLAV